MAGPVGGAEPVRTPVLVLLPEGAGGTLRERHAVHLSPLDQGRSRRPSPSSRRSGRSAFPLLLDGDRTVAEATVIIEHLDLHHPGPVRLIPADPAAALEVRFLDRFFDNYVQTPMQKPVLDAMRGRGRHAPRGVAEARATLDRRLCLARGSHGGPRMGGGRRFSLADCAAAPALFYADWVHPIGAPSRRSAPTGPAQRTALLRARDRGGAALRALFPLGAPDRD